MPGRPSPRGQVPCILRLRPASLPILPGLLMLLATVAVVPARAADPELALTSRDGQRVVVRVKEFDNRGLSFELRDGKRKQTVPLAEIARIEFPPFDTTAHPLREDTLDVFRFRDGQRLKGVFRNLDDDRVVAHMGAARSEQRYSHAALVSIDLSLTPLDVDRREFGKGGFELMNSAVEMWIANSMTTAVAEEMELLEDEEVNRYLDALGQDIASGSKRPGLEYRFQVVNDRTVNAFTIGGGFVYLNRGLLEAVKDESELAGVIAHEIGHNVGRHTVRSLYKGLMVGGLVGGAEAMLSPESSADSETWTDLLGNLLTSKYSRDDEREADYLAYYNLVQRGYDPAGLVGLFETFKRLDSSRPGLLESFLASHPDHDERIENISAEMARHGAAGGRRDSPGFQAMKRRLAQLPMPMRRVLVMADTVAVAAYNRTTLKFEQPDSALGKPVLKGAFRAYGGSGNDIRLLIFKDMDYLNWSNGHAGKALYDSGQLTIAEFEVALPTVGRYWFVFDNTFSMFTPKQVVVRMMLEGEAR